MFSEYFPTPEKTLAVRQLIKDARAGLGMDVNVKLLQDSKKKYAQTAIDHYSAAVFNAYNAKIEFKQSEEDRQKLLTQPGVILANHPGFFDIPIILQALKDAQGRVRRDLKILVQKSTYKMFADNLGDQYFIELVPKEYLPAKQAFDQALKHIREGGIFLFFPSGGVE